jgi:hypothetical protein
MALYFHNGTGSTMYVALAYHSPGCDGDNWAKKGWWSIPPGGRATVRGGASNGAKYFWYAENDAGLQWAGPFTTHLPSRVFDWCWRTGSTDSRLLGLRMLVVPASSINHSIVLQG